MSPSPLQQLSTHLSGSKWSRTLDRHRHSYRLIMERPYGPQHAPGSLHKMGSYERLRPAPKSAGVPLCSCTCCTAQGHGIQPQHSMEPQMSTSYNDSQRLQHVPCFSPWAHPTHSHIHLYSGDNFQGRTQNQGDPPALSRIKPHSCSKCRENSHTDQRVDPLGKQIPAQQIGAQRQARNGRPTVTFETRISGESPPDLSSTLDSSFEDEDEYYDERDIRNRPSRFTFVDYYELPMDIWLDLIWAIDPTTSFHRRYNTWIRIKNWFKAGKICYDAKRRTLDFKDLYGHLSTEEEPVPRARQHGTISILKALRRRWGQLSDRLILRAPMPWWQRPEGV